MPLILFLLCWSTLVWARSNPKDFCFDGCQLALGAIQFNITDPGTGEPWTNEKCRNGYKIPSLYLCTKAFCNLDETCRGLIRLNGTCQTRYNTSLPPHTIIDAFSDEDVMNLRHLQPEEASWDSHTSISEIVIPSQELFRLAFDTLDAAHFETRIHNVYGLAMYWFWVVVVTLGMSSHLAQRLFTSTHGERIWQPLLGDENDSFGSPTTKGRRNAINCLYTLLKRSITVPATFGYKHSQNVWWCTIPTRIQSITIGAFIVINIMACLCSYRVFPHNLYWPSVYAQWSRYFADRTGIISTANLPLIWLFGIRNNTLLWLTGWDFATYNNFHRWVARVATFEAVLHSIAYTVLIFSGHKSFVEAWGYYLSFFRMRYFFGGVIATIFMVAICTLSLYPLRRNFYEIFLALHIILSIILILTMWWHVEIFHGYVNYIWPCVFIWVFDRVLRGLRILLFNPKFYNTKALTIYDQQSNIVRLVVPYSSSFVKPRPGTFYYIYTLNSWKLWESHPFTLGYTTSDQLISKSPNFSLGTMSHPRQATSHSTHRSASVSSYFPESETLLDSTETYPPSSMVFIIRPYSGFTARLRDSALHSPITHRVIIEGPYGETQPFLKYDNVLFIVGGTGIAVPLSYLNTILRGDSKTISLRIVWAVREIEFLSTAINTDFRRALDESEKLSLTAYITQGGDGKDEGIEVMGREIKVFRGRPNVYEEVEEAARESGGGPLAVVACGPGQMADDARKTVVELLGKGYSRIEYFEESFNW